MVAIVIGLDNDQRNHGLKQGRTNSLKEWQARLGAALQGLEVWVLK